MIGASLTWPGFPDGNDRPADVDVSVETQRLAEGNLDHRVNLSANHQGSPVWSKEITFGVDAPFAVPDLANDDPFLIASLFPVMGLGGTLRFHGKVSRTLLRNVLDYQSAWFRAAPEFCTPFTLEVDEIDDETRHALEPRPKAILAFTGGLDSLLALCRNVSGDAEPAGHDIGATMMIHGMGTQRSSADGPNALTTDLRRISESWDAPMAVVDTNIAEVVGLDDISHGTWLAACLSLFAGRFDIGLLGSSVPYFWDTWELFGSHPLLDPLLSGAEMVIRNDEGLYERTDKAALLCRYPTALEDLRVCIHISGPDRNCCRCEKCLRTMLCFVAAGKPIPPAFPNGLQLSDIGIGLGQQTGLDWAPVILNSARLYGTDDEEAMRVLRRRARAKWAKVKAKALTRLVKTGRSTHRWHVIDDVLSKKK
ncbi:MAG: hypothetical protein AAF414_06335 [Pseudomonadota bacterium]